MLEAERTGGPAVTLSAPRREIRARHMQASHFVPDELLKAADAFEGKGTGAGAKLDRYTRLVILTVPVAAILVIVLSS
jgi:hypothetical protein